MKKTVRDILTKRIVTTEEAAALMGVDPSTVKYRIKTGRLEAVKKGKTWLIYVGDIV